MDRGASQTARIHTPQSAHTGHSPQLLPFSGAMEAGGGAAAVAAVGGDDEREAMGFIRAVARANFIFGVAAAAFGLFVATLHPERTQHGGECASTAVDAVMMRTDGLLLLLSSGAQAAAATVAAFAPDAWSWRRLHFHVAWSVALFAHGASVGTYFHLMGAFDSAAAVAVGSCTSLLHDHRADFSLQGSNTSSSSSRSASSSSQGSARSCSRLVVAPLDPFFDRRHASLRRRSTLIPT